MSSACWAEFQLNPDKWLITTHFQNQYVKYLHNILDLVDHKYFGFADFCWDILDLSSPNRTFTSHFYWYLTTNENSLEDR